MTAPARSGPVVVIGAAGGCGTTLLAGGLALAWRRGGASARVVELRPGLADAWDLPGDRTLADLAAVADELRPHHLDAAAQHHESGVTALVAAADPRSPAWEAAATGGLVAAIAASAGRSAIDAGAGLDPPARAAAAAAGRVLLLCPPRLASARRARCLAEALGAADCGLVAAGGPVRGELGPRALARAVGVPLAGALPWAPREAAALGAGRWPRGRRRRLAAAVAALAEAAG